MIKYYCRVTPEISEQLQKRAFKLGWTWVGRCKQIKNTDAKYLYFTDAKSLQFSYCHMEHIGYSDIRVFPIQILKEDSILKTLLKEEKNYV